MDGTAIGAGLIPAVLSGFGASAVAARVLRRIGVRRSALLALVPAALTVYFVSLVEPVSNGRIFVSRIDWLDELGLALTLRLDGLSLLFALLITGIGTLVTVYAGPYLARDRGAERFFVFLMAFMASMLGLVLSVNLLATYVFWELTSVCSYFLIAFHHEHEDARTAALQSLLVTALGGLVLLAGIILLGLAGGSFELTVLVERRAQVIEHPLYVPALLLVALGCFTKSAQFPFHFWLPRAMEAPTPASAYLHAATMVKAGVFLLMRLSPVLGGTELWTLLLTAVGGVTLVQGAMVAVVQTHLKRLLAYATVSALGMLIFLVGVGTEEALSAALLYLLAHALYKGALFLVAGNVGHEAGSLELRHLSGLRRDMPWTAAIAALAALSLAGVPPLLGFVGKEAAYAALPSAGLAILAVAGSALLVTAAGLVGLRPFSGPAMATPRAAREVPFAMLIPAALLSVAGMLSALRLSAVEKVLSPALAAIVPGAERHHLVLWHGVSRELLMSGLTLAAGLALYFARSRLMRLLKRLATPNWLSLSVSWDRGFDKLLALSERITSLLQSGYLRRYVFAYTVAIVLGSGAAYLASGERPAGASVGLRVHEVVIAFAIVVATLATVLAGTRMAAITAMCVAGFGVALLFLFFGAPDLAMTQVVVESLTVVIFVLAFRRLPAFADLSTSSARLRDAVLSILLGAVMTLLVRSASATQFQPPASEWFLEKSVPEGHGRNAVNVIITDFRAVDTLGEITVLAVATFGIVALVRIGRLRRLGKEPP